ncbi:positive regulation of nucleotide-binding oligomerization domain containing 1 signaling pathway [Mactra antiquata]
MLLISLVFLNFALTAKVHGEEGNSFQKCFMSDSRNILLKHELNCGNQQCYCNSGVAHCVGDEFSDKLPPLDDSIIELHAKCYDLRNVSHITFAEVSKNMETIHLQKCPMQHMSRDTFKDFHALRDVRFSEANAINQTKLGEALGSVKNLKRLTLNKMEFTYLNEKLFSHLDAPNLEFLDLSGNRLQKVNLSLFNNFTSLRCLNFSYNLVDKLNPKDAIPLDKLKLLKLNGNQLSADGLHFCGNTPAPEVPLFPNLEKLHLEDNFITSNVEELICLPKLTELYMGFNRLQNISITTFSSFQHLQRLSFRANWISNVTAGIFPPKLIHLDLRENEISTFPPKLCDINTKFWNNNLKYLNLSRNYISKIMIQNWECLTKLEYLDLSKNDVSEIYNNTFMPLVSLKELYLDNMVPYVTVIQPYAFKTPSNTLRKLSLRFDRIDFGKRSMQEIFKSCPSVIHLDISYNYFKHVTEATIVDLLSPMKQLDTLWAVSINLQRFPSSFLTTFQSLTYLDVNRNHLNNIEFPAEFNDVNLNISLQELHVAECSINTVDEKAFPVAIRKSLRKLDISRNEFACGCKLIWFRDKVKENGFLFNIELIHWPKKYECRSPSGLVGEQVKHFTPEELCSLIGVVSIAVATTVVMIAVLALVCYWKWWTLTYWWHKMLRKRRNKQGRLGDSERQPLLNRIKYDGFVIYDAGDDDFVHHRFLDVMEQRLKYKLHVWKRNAANGTLIDVILDGMDDSNQIIVVVTNKLTKNQWCKFQVDVAIDRSYYLNKNNVLLVVLEDTNFRYVSKAWCVLFAKTPKAFWCNDDDIHDVKWKLFEQTIVNHFGSPLSECAENSIQ